MARIDAEDRTSTAEDRADSERAARIAAEDRATAAEARIRELEARLYNPDLSPISNHAPTSPPCPCRQGFSFDNHHSSHVPENPRARTR